MGGRNSDWPAMHRTGTHSQLGLLAGLTVLLFVAGRLASGALGPNNWSFTHWQALARPSAAAWLAVALVLGVALGRFLPAIAAFLQPRRKAAVGATLLIVLIVLLRCDSFVAGGGNLRIAQIAQTADVILPWYEYGAVAAVRLFYRCGVIAGLPEAAAAAAAWQVFGFACTILALAAAWRLARLLSDDPTRRLGLFVIVFFGPQTAVYFGFIGPVPVIAAAALWLAYALVRAAEKPSPRRLGLVWGVFALSVAMHAAMVFALPAVVAGTVGGLRRRGRPGVAPFLAGAVVWIGLPAALYLVANEYLPLKASLLLAAGKPPHGDYSLFSPRRLGDLGQVLFLLFPLGLVALYALIRWTRRAVTDLACSTALLLFLGGLSAVFVIDPVHSIVLDLPLYAPFLAPGAVFLAVSLRATSGSPSISPSALGMIAAASLMLPAGYLPVYTRLATVERYITPYLDRHSAYYRTAAVALRDAYFYRKDLERANYWDQSYRRKSPDYLNLTGIEDFILAQRLDIALPSLNKLIARNPYWAESRAVYGKVMTEQRRFDLGKPQLDTALMLEPYNPRRHMNLYGYYRDKGEFAQALTAVTRAAELFPNNDEIRTDLMIISYRAGHGERARELAEHLLRLDSTRAYPYAIMGFLAEEAGDLSSAMANFERFCSLAPEAPETPQIRKRANAIYLKLNPAAP